MVNAVTSDDVSLAHTECGEIEVRERNGRAWVQLNGPSSKCRFCGHLISEHVMNSFAPHYYQPLSISDLDQGLPKLARHPADPAALLRRVVVDEAAEIEFLFCPACASEKGTRQSLCYRRRIGVGEVVGDPEQCARIDDPEIRVALAIARVLFAPADVTAQGLE